MKSPKTAIDKQAEKRQRERREPSLSLKVFDRDTGIGIGPLGNISLGGLMVFSEQVYETGAEVAFAMVLPAKINGRFNLSFDARCVWCRRQAEESESTYIAGFEINSIDQDNKNILQVLTTKFC